MYLPSKAIFDTTVLTKMVEMKSIELVNVLPILFQQILIPQMVAAEFGKLKNVDFIAKVDFLLNQIQQNRFFQFCTAFNAVIFEEAQKLNGIDIGEADAIAQSDVTNVLLFITDDIRCQPIIQQYYPNIRLHTTFYLLAIAHFQGLLANEEMTLKEFHVINRVDNMKSKARKQYLARLRNEATEAMRILGIPFDKKRLSNLTSLKNRI